MEYGSIEREIQVDAAPEIVFEVVSRPEHIAEWWTDSATFDPAPGSVGELVWGDREDVSPIKIITSEPPRIFAFRWRYPDAVDDAASSLLVTFELVPSGAGTRIKLTETGFREMGWEAAVLEEQYRAHNDGWNFYIPRLGDYLAGLVSAP